MSDDLRTVARRALDDVATNVGFARAVVDGTAAGSLWCDRVRDPRAFHAVHPYGMSLVWGDAVDDVFDDVVERLHERRAAGLTEWLQVDPRWHGLDWDGALGAVPLDVTDPASPPATTRHTRVNFTLDATTFAATSAAVRLDDGWVARPATEADFGARGVVVPSAFWPDAPTFLAHGGGVALERSGQVGAIAFVSYRWDDQVEIGIETHPDHRRRGLACGAAAAMIRTVLDDDATPVWSCREDNTGSMHLARSLGFVPVTWAPYFHLDGRVP